MRTNKKLALYQPRTNRTCGTNDKKTANKDKYIGAEQNQLQSTNLNLAYLTEAELVWIQFYFVHMYYGVKGKTVHRNKKENIVLFKIAWYFCTTILAGKCCNSCHLLLDVYQGTHSHHQLIHSCNSKPKGKVACYFGGILFFSANKLICRDLT